MTSPFLLLRRIRHSFLLLPVLYVITLCAMATMRSGSRHSVVGNFLGESEATSSPQTREEFQDGSSKVYLQNFERVEFRLGSPAWSMKAKDARYFPLDAVTVINEPHLKIHRDRDQGDDILLSADVARCSTVGSELLDARMDGNVSGALGGGVEFFTREGAYNVKERAFRTREEMKVEGQGFQVRGQGFLLYMDSGIMEFQSGVESVFHPGAKTPKNLLQGEGKRMPAQENTVKTPAKGRKSSPGTEKKDLS